MNEVSIEGLERKMMTSGIRGNAMKIILLKNFRGDDKKIQITIKKDTGFMKIETPSIKEARLSLPSIYFFIENNKRTATKALICPITKKSTQYQIVNR